MNETTLRVCAVLGGVLLGVIFIALVGFLLPDWLIETLFGNYERTPDDNGPPYPFTIQNGMWLLFFAAMSDVLVRFFQGGQELRQMGLGLLPEDEETVLQSRHLPEIYDLVRPPPLGEPRILQRLIMRIILQFQSSRSVDQANALLNSSLELVQHEIDLKYNMPRYTAWLIPTLGFIGTVIGIALALDQAGQMPDLGDEALLAEWLSVLTGKLALAFDTTLVALLLSAVLMFLMHVAQGREESALNRAGHYCLDNLVNRLYEKD